MDNNSVINIAAALELQPDAPPSEEPRRTALPTAAVATTSAGTTGTTTATREDDQVLKSFYFPEGAKKTHRSYSGTTRPTPATGRIASGARTNPSSLTSSPVSFNNSIKSFPSKADVRPRPSIDDLVKPPSVRSSSSSSSSSRSTRPPEHPAKKKGGFTITYKKDPLAASGRTSSRYYERMGSRSWLPSINTKRSSTMLVPHVSEEAQTPSTQTFGNSPSPSSHVSSEGTPPHTPDWPSFAYPRAALRPKSQSSAAPKSSLRNDSLTTNNDNSTNERNTPGDAESELLPGDMIGAVPPLALYTHVPRIFGEEPPQISGHSCVLVKNRLVVYGGKTVDGFSQALYVFNCVTSTLSRALYAGGPPPMVLDSSATLVRHKFIYYFGGLDAADRCRNDLWVLNTATMRFSQPRLDPEDQRRPCPRRGHSKVLYDNTLFVFGGFDADGEALNDVWRFDIGNAQWTEVLSLDKDTAHWPAARGNHTAHVAAPGAALRDTATKTMVVYGGNDARVVFDDVWVFDFERARWSALGDTVVKPEPNALQEDAPASPTSTLSGAVSSRRRTLHTAYLSGKYLMVVGGHDGEDTVASLDILNLHSRRWTVRSTYGLQTLGPCYHAGILYDSRYYIVGGYDMNQILVGLQVIEIPMFPCVTS